MSRKELAEAVRTFRRHYPDINATDAEIEDFIVDMNRESDGMVGEQETQDNRKYIQTTKG